MFNKTIINQLPPIINQLPPIAQKSSRLPQLPLTLTQQFSRNLVTIHQIDRHLHYPRHDVVDSKLYTMNELKVIDPKLLSPPYGPYGPYGPNDNILNTSRKSVSTPHNLQEKLCDQKIVSKSFIHNRQRSNSVIHTIRYGHEHSLSHDTNSSRLNYESDPDHSPSPTQDETQRNRTQKLCVDIL